MYKFLVVALLALCFSHPLLQIHLGCDPDFMYPVVALISVVALQYVHDIVALICTASIQKAKSYSRYIEEE